ncbi:MAG: HD domain-containing protein [Candidatus Absconditabacterales bacterium]|nr:HD domain-containing protein [Candidatus Absconditabacterales bacterium]
MSGTDKIVEKYLGYLKNVYPFFERDFSIIQKASKVAQEAHKGQFRKLTGTAFIAHPLRVAIMVAEKTNDLTLILAAILHDVVEDSFEKFSMSYIYKNFGDEVGFLVDSVTANIDYYYKNPKTIFEEKTDKFLYGVMKDIRCAFLKLMDRDHNNKTLEGLKIDKQIRKSFETQALYNPLKKIIGLDDKKFVYKEAQDRFIQYLKKKKIKNTEELRSSLYQDVFEDLDSYNFQLFYYSSNNIVRKIENKKMFEKLIENNYFDNKVEILSITEDIYGNFNCLFRYEKGKICCQDVKMKVSNFQG